ncbi:MAG: hypothetical protein PHY54_12320 [Methylococcales bacterium]|nr:hypothetical protein [Methylococcales bacterium]
MNKTGTGVRVLQCGLLKITHKVFAMRSNIFFVLALMLFSFSAAAEVPLTQADILGSWQIDKESLQSDGSKSRSINSTWTFKNDGTMEGVSQDSDAHARMDTLRASLNYSIEDGKIVKQAAPGRSKMETCAAVEKENDKMTLKCQAIYFFMTKK